MKAAIVSSHISKTLPLYTISRAEEPGHQSEKNLLFVKDAYHNTLISGYMLSKLTTPELLVPHNLHTSSFPSIF